MSGTGRSFLFLLDFLVFYTKIIITTGDRNMFNNLAWICYIISFVSFMFLGYIDIGFYALLIGMILHWKFWFVILIGFVIGNSISK